MGGTRVLRISLAAIVGLMRWPFADDASVTLVEHRLPADARFVRVVRIDGEHAYVLLMSSKWHGHSDVPLPAPKFKTNEPGRGIITPDGRDLALLFGKEH